jgi:hypothetical protein
MRHFLFETKEYRINPRFRRRRNEQDSAQALARLLRQMCPRKRGSAGNGGGRRTDARQKCVVKTQYSDSVEAHRVQLERYLVREGTDIDGSRAKLYGTDLEEYRSNMTGRNFRVFLSPQSDRIDLGNLAAELVKKLEQQTGYSLYWQAANHYNTAHPHAHLLINGKDKNGKEVAFPRDVVKTFMREYARDICTAQIGNRTRAEIALDHEQELSAGRYTLLDGKIKEISGGALQVNPQWIKADRERLLARLENLRKMNLCVYKDGAYRLSPGWEDDLRANGRYNAYLDARSKLQYTDQANLKVFSGEQGIIIGKVTRAYRTDGDASDNHALVVEGLDGKAYFVPLFRKPEMYDGKEKTEVKEGELVSIKTYESQRGRLTPVIFRREASQVRKEILKNGYTGGLASEIMSRRGRQDEGERKHGRVY